MTGSTKAPRDWVIPRHRTTMLAPRTHDHALVIPVINEGVRIRDQLQRIQVLRPDVDVVIADGGSTDGSLEPGFLSDVGVRCVLVKEGPGKLGAQLRMGYAWCLIEGYSGVVTMDGNGKDDVEALDRFVALLREGYDLVQGSRYRPGGKAVNTPWDRHLAVRLIHAPLVSLAARTLYTDTTNGFRAYSARLLLDPRVAPFRDVFDCYGLLFYLSIRAPRLGYKVTETPVTRLYPRTGPTPTRISGLGPRVALLGELLAAAFHRYDP